MSKRIEYGYGFFCGGDPRKFYPDPECCSQQEIANHNAACKLWNEAESRAEKSPDEKCPSYWIMDADGKGVGHVLRAPYGIGSYQYDVTDEEEEK